MRSPSALPAELITGRDPVARDHESSREGALREVIGSQAARLCFETYGHSLRAVVLTGSLARDEATLAEEKTGSRLLGDAEFLLIFNPEASLPPKAAMGFLRQSIEAAISRSGITGEVSLSPAHPRYLSRLRPSIFAYELRECGKVVLGDPEILNFIAGFSASDIPLEDGWRLLSNRMIEELEVLEGLEQGLKILPSRLFYRTVKLYLDLATSFLLFAGEYCSFYSQRAERLRALADRQSADPDYPFDLRHLYERVSECTHWKVSALELHTSFFRSGGDSDFSWWEEAVMYARLLWRWELARLTQTKGQASNCELLDMWMRSQPPSRRLRGWLYVLRDQGWHRSWRNWPRWARLARKASPRYWIYGAAGELFSRLPCLLKHVNGGARSDVDWEALLSWLPVRPESRQHRRLPPYRELAVEVTRNYNEFLVETRS